jgi:hypothetical protein
MAVAPDVTINGKLAAIVFQPQTAETPTASLPEFGTLQVALCNYGPKTPTVGGEALMARVTVSEIGVAGQGSSAPEPGNFQFYLYSNQLIEPPGTYYTITTRDGNGDAVQTEAYYFEPGEWDLSTMLPFDPGQPPPPLPPLIISQLQIVGPSPNPVFDGTNFTAFQITLPGDVAQAIFQNMIAGNLYTFIIIQDGTGNHAFGWPANAYNTTPIHQTPNTYTIQTFVADEGGSLYAIGPGTWYEL